jgi:hypothetical protein
VHPDKAALRICSSKPARSAGIHRQHAAALQKTFAHVLSAAICFCVGRRRDRLYRRRPTAEKPWTGMAPCYIANRTGYIGTARAGARAHDASAADIAVATSTALFGTCRLP